MDQGPVLILEARLAGVYQEPGDRVLADARELSTAPRKFGTSQEFGAVAGL